MAIKFSDKRNNQYVKMLDTLAPGDTFQKGDNLYVKAAGFAPADTLGAFNLNTSLTEIFPKNTPVETVEIEIVIRQTRRERKQSENSEESEDTPTNE